MSEQRQILEQLARSEIFRDYERAFGDAAERLPKWILRSRVAGIALSMPWPEAPHGSDGALPFTPLPEAVFGIRVWTPSTRWKALASLRGGRGTGEGLDELDD